MTKLALIGTFGAWLVLEILAFLNSVLFKGDRLLNGKMCCPPGPTFGESGITISYSYSLKFYLRALS